MKYVEIIVGRRETVKGMRFNIRLNGRKVGISSFRRNFINEMALSILFCLKG